MSSLTTEGGNFVERMMTGEFEKTCVLFHGAGSGRLTDPRVVRLKSAEAPEEEPTVSKEQFLEVKCNISGTTNYMMQGISEVRRRIL